MIYKFEDKYPTIVESAFIAGSADVIGDVTIGEDCSIWFGAVLRGDENYIKVEEELIFKIAVLYILLVINMQLKLENM